MKKAELKKIIKEEIKSVLNEMSIQEIKGRIFDVLNLPETQQYKVDDFTYENIPLSIFEQNGVMPFQLKQYEKSNDIITFDLGININPIKRNVDVFLQKQGIFS